MAFLTAIDACGARHPVASGPQIGTEAAQLPVREARASLDSALAGFNIDGLEAAMSDSIRLVDHVTHRSVVGKASVIALLAQVTRDSSIASVLAAAQGSDYCPSGGFEFGTYTRYAAGAPQSPSAGDYALRWRIEGQRARLVAVVLGPSGAFRGAPALTVCTASRSERMRNNRLYVMVAPTTGYVGWHAPTDMNVSSQRSGWSVGAKDQPCGNVVTYPDPPARAGGFSDVYGGSSRDVEVGVRVRMTGNLSTEVWLSPRTPESCMSNYNPTRNSLIRQRFSGAEQMALVSWNIRDFRVGLGIAAAQARIVMREDTVIVAHDSSGTPVTWLAYVRDTVRTSHAAFGLAGAVSYNIALGNHAFLEFGSRTSVGLKAHPPRIRAFDPAPVSLSVFTFAIRAGFAL